MIDSLDVPNEFEFHHIGYATRSIERELFFFHC